MNRPANLIPAAYERLLKQYEAAGDDFQITTRPYYSSGAFRFTVDSRFGPVAGAQRVGLLAPAGQTIMLFSYALTQSVAGANLGNRVATEADTNIAEAQETNDEDFAIEGISATARGVRCDYAVGTFPEVFPNVSENLVEAITDATTPIYDPSSLIIPAEVGSPLTLQDTLFEALKPYVTLTESWNRKGGDHYGTLDQVPEGGAKSYLGASGEPTHHNFFRMPEGKIWRREGATQDTKYQLTARLEQDVYVIVSEPGVLTVEDGGLGDLTALWLDWKLRLHGHAFYYPSHNA
ncbi:MAG: hypothetical protein KF718_16825 [Polyangiaceae bacterium]|nr:hypothetical protein [Polyangiaceae bacterium]